jgi:hypothetical protein
LLSIKKIKEKGLSYRLIWDFFVISLVFTNINLILFDLTYLLFRPFYFTNIPKIVKLYDPILGIEPHRTTNDYIQSIQILKDLQLYNDEENRNLKIKELINEIQSQYASFSKNEKYNQLIVLDLETKDFDQTLLIEKQAELFQTNLNSLKNLLPLKEYQDLESKIKDLNKISNLKLEANRTLEFQKTLEKMDVQMVKIVEENPFKESGLTHNYTQMQKIIKQMYEEVATSTLDEDLRTSMASSFPIGKRIPSTSVAFSYFWRDSNKSIQDKLIFFEENFYPLIAVNYYRRIDVDGQFVNDFYKIDFPFYMFFLIELLFRWYYAIKNKQYMAWFLYPIYHWYDVLGLIPLAQFKFFRLFRIYTIYLILEETQLTNIGNDFISRSIKYYSNIVKEEISDMVTVQILSEAQEEIRSGSSIEVLTNAINSHRDKIKKVVINKMKDDSSKDRIVKVVRELMEHFISRVGLINKLPFGISEKYVKESLVVFYLGINKVIQSTVESEDGRITVEKVIDLILDELVASAKDPETNELNTAITIELLENVKEQVKVKKWLNTEI